MSVTNDLEALNDGSNVIFEWLITLEENTEVNVYVEILYCIHKHFIMYIINCPKNRSFIDWSVRNWKNFVKPIQRKKSNGSRVKWILDWKGGKSPQPISSIRCIYRFIRVIDPCPNSLISFIVLENSQFWFLSNFIKTSF